MVITKMGNFTVASPDTDNLDRRDWACELCDFGEDENPKDEPVLGGRDLSAGKAPLG